LLRTYPTKQPGLVTLASNPNPADLPFAPPRLSSDCEQGRPCLRRIGVTALTIQQLLGKDQTLVYNGRGLTLDHGLATKEQLTDPDAIVYVRDDDLCKPGSSLCVDGGRLLRGRMVEPLVLRVAAGDVVELTLTNAMTGSEPVFTTPISGQRIPYTAPFASVTLEPSTSVGLHPQLLAADIRMADGTNVGTNPDSTVPPGDHRTFTWYAGTIEAGPDGRAKPTQVEFGAVNLLPSDPLNHAYRGLFGGLIVEPAGSRWVEDPGDASQATVFTADGAVFRDLVVNGQDDADILLNGQSNYSAGNALSAVNYRTEPAIYRYGEKLQAVLQNTPPSSSCPNQVPKDWSNLTETDLACLGNIQWSAVDTSIYLTNTLVGADPATPIYRAPAGMPVRFRLLHAGGNGDNQQVFELSGHVWQAEPYVNGSASIGDNKASPYQGVQSGYGVTSHYDVVIASAGGTGRVAGDYVYRTWTADQFQVGFWGLFRVSPSPGGYGFADTVAIDQVAPNPGGQGVVVSGRVTVRPARDPAARVVTGKLMVKADGGAETTVTVAPDGFWTASLTGKPRTVVVTSPFGGSATWTAPAPAAVMLMAAQANQPLVVQRFPIRNRRHVGLAQP
jgi:hypothetical protein